MDHPEGSQGLQGKSRNQGLELLFGWGLPSWPRLAGVLHCEYREADPLMRAPLVELTHTLRGEVGHKRTAGLRQCYYFRKVGSFLIWTKRGVAVWQGSCKGGYFAQLFKYVPIQGSSSFISLLCLQLVCFRNNFHKHSHILLRWDSWRPWSNIFWLQVIEISSVFSNQ